MVREAFTNRQNNRSRLPWRAVLGGLVLGGLVFVGTGCASPPPGRIERVAADMISFPAVVTADRFERRLLGMPGYHYIVWSDGGAAPAALFQAAVSDVQVLEALQALGARPGNALGMETWERREDPDAKAPEEIIQGPVVEVLVRVPGRREPLTMDQILLDPGGRGFEMRFGGHRANIHHWHSGCVVCLYSCPGSKVGNARYTVRDYVKDPARFRVRPGVLPRDGTEVSILLRLVKPGGS
ncbi:MAG TPA: YdjY domain-containing protein [Thermoanaerobaculia bacterium]|nr:YdjY domain-containing protein [Thermoanaerobaculia bacterium]